MKKTKVLALSLCCASILGGCALSDYTGHPGHKTQGFAHLYNIRANVSGFGERDGTYVYAAKYNNLRWASRNFRPKVEMVTYRNYLSGSFPSRPGVITDAFRLEGARGFSGGVFERFWSGYDTNPDSRDGLDNLKRDHPLDDDGNWIAPALMVQTQYDVEVDLFDVDLQSTVKNPSALLSNLVKNGGSLKGIEFTVVGIEINGQKAKVSPYTFGADISNGGQVAINLTYGSGIKSVIGNILEMTEHNVPVKGLKLTFANGMEIETPKIYSFSFNHNVLNQLMQK